MSVTVEKLISDFELEVLVEGEKNVKISVNDINRPGLQLAGFYNYFAPERIQVIGKAEWSFLDDMGIELMRKRSLPCILQVNLLQKLDCMVF